MSNKIIIALLVLNTIIHTAEIIIDLQQAGIITWAKNWF